MHANYSSIKLIREKNKHLITSEFQKREKKLRTCLVSTIVLTSLLMDSFNLDPSRWLQQ